MRFIAINLQRQPAADDPHYSLAVIHGAEELTKLALPVYAAAWSCSGPDGMTPAHHLYIAAGQLWNGVLGPSPKR